MWDSAPLFSLCAENCFHLHRFTVSITTYSRGNVFKTSLPPLIPSCIVLIGGMVTFRWERGGEFERGARAMDDFEYIKNKLAKTEDRGTPNSPELCHLWLLVYQV